MFHSATGNCILFGGVTASDTWCTPMLFWDGGRPETYISRPGQCVGCGAPGMTYVPCEYCGGKDVEERKP